MTDAEIIAKLKQVTAAPFIVFPAVVSSVNETAHTAVVKPSGGGAEMSIRLKAGEDAATEYHMVIPRVKSTVLVGLIMNDEDEGFLVRANEIDKFMVKIGTKTLVMTKDNTLFNGGLNGGLINIEQLKTEYNKTKALVDGLKAAIDGWIPVPNDGGAALKGLLSGQLAGKSTGSFDAITDETIKH